MSTHTAVMIQLCYHITLSVYPTPVPMHHKIKFHLEVFQTLVRYGLQHLTGRNADDLQQNSGGFVDLQSSASSSEEEICSDRNKCYLTSSRRSNGGSGKNIEDYAARSSSKEEQKALETHRRLLETAESIHRANQVLFCSVTTPSSFFL